MQRGALGTAGGGRTPLERLLRGRILGPTIDEQLAEEIDLHIELLARELMEDGMSEDRARAEAAQRFNDRAQVTAACARIARRTERRWRLRIYLAEAAQDVRYALRQLARARSFTAVALLTLAVGIGATTAIFSVVEGVVLRRLPFAHPERAVAVAEAGFGGGGSDFSVGNFADLRAAATGFTAFSAYRFHAFNLAEGDHPERVLAVQATHGFFDVFGVPPLLGRTFGADEDVTGRDQVAVLSHELWRTHFGADPAILDRIVHLSGAAYRVVGVMPAVFDPTLNHEDLWMPLAFTPAQVSQHDDHFLDAVALLRPGVSLAAARDQLTAPMRRLVKLYPEANVARTGVRLRPLGEELVGDYRQRLFVLLGAVGLVMLIACANVASLLLARGSARARELAIRVAVGAGGRRTLRQLLTESAVLALGGGALGVGLAAAALGLFVRLAPPGIPRAAEVRIDGTVLLFALGLSLAASLIFGMVPALRAARQDPQALLRGTAGGGWTSGGGSPGAPAAAGSGRRPGRDGLRNLLVATELALALTLLAGAGLLIRSAFNLERTPLGFDAARVTVARLSLPEATYPRPAAVAQTFDELAARLAHAPGVRAAAAVSAAPLGPNRGSNGLLPEGKSFSSENLINAYIHIITPGYFAALRQPLLAGRPFAPSDVTGQPKVMIVSRMLARRAWGDGDPIGRRIACCDGTPQEPGWKTVVGVVGDVRSLGAAADIAPEFYLPIGQVPAAAWDWNQRTMTLVARGDDPGLLAAALRSTVHGVDPTLALNLATFEDEARGSTAEERFHTVLLLSLGLIGLILAAVGTYGVVAYFAGLRTQEIGVRMALGAQRRDILALLSRQGAPPVVAGLVAGTAGALAATQWLRSSLFGVQPTDPWTFACVIALLALTAAVAVLVPAIDAARLDPKQAIQSP